MENRTIAWLGIGVGIVTTVWTYLRGGGAESLIAGAFIGAIVAGLVKMGNDKLSQ